MPDIDIDRDAAHDAAQRELDKAMYPRGSLTEQFAAWIDDLIYKIMAGGASVPGGWLTISVLLILVAVAVVVAVRVARRTMRTNRRRHDPLFGASEMSSGEHRATADRFAAAGDWSSAIRHRVRAIARHLEETAVLHPVPGRTATELARDAGQAIPGLTAEWQTTATIFNDVTYGEQPGTEVAFTTVADLDDRLRSHVPRALPADPPTAPAEEWVEVR